MIVNWSLLCSRRSREGYKGLQSIFKSKTITVKKIKKGKKDKYMFVWYLCVYMIIIYIQIIFFQIFLLNSTPPPPPLKYFLIITCFEYMISTWSRNGGGKYFKELRLTYVAIRYEARQKYTTLRNSIKNLEARHRDIKQITETDHRKLSSVLFQTITVDGDDAGDDFDEVCPYWTFVVQYTCTIIL